VTRVTAPSVHTKEKECEEVTEDREYNHSESLVNYGTVVDATTVLKDVEPSNTVSSIDQDCSASVKESVIDAGNKEASPIALPIAMDVNDMTSIKGLLAEASPPTQYAIFAEHLMYDLCVYVTMYAA
jgi:hypothetical protein